MDDHVIGAPIVTENGEDFVTIAEAARELKKAENTIRYWIKQGLLDTYQRGSSPMPIYVKRSELQELVKMVKRRPTSAPSDPNLELPPGE